MRVRMSLGSVQPLGNTVPVGDHDLRVDSRSLGPRPTKLAAGSLRIVGRTTPRKCAAFADALGPRRHPILGRRRFLEAF